MLGQVRQGDILLTKVAPVEDAKMIKRIDHNIIAEGEATGHNHVVEGNAELVEVNINKNEPTMFVVVGGPAQLVHTSGDFPDHNPIDLDPGWWEVSRQREYDPAIYMPSGELRTEWQQRQWEAQRRSRVSD